MGGGFRIARGASIRGAVHSVYGMFPVSMGSSISMALQERGRIVQTAAFPELERCMRASSVLRLALILALAGCSTATRPPGAEDPLTTVARRLGLSLTSTADARAHDKTGEDKPDATKHPESHAGTTPKNSESTTERGDSAPAVARPPISRTAALQLAFRNNPEVAQHTAALGLAEADYRAAGTLSNPVANLGTRLPADGVGVLSLEFDLMGDLLQVLQRGDRLAASGLRMEETIFAISDLLLDFAARVDRAYFDLQAALHRQRVMRRLSRTAQARAQRSASLAAHQLLDGTSAARHRIVATQTALEARRADLEVAVSRTVWARMLAHADDATLPLPAPQLPALPAQPSTVAAPAVLALEERLDLKAARKAIEARAAEHRIALDWRWWSVLELGTMGERDSDGQLVMGPAFSIALPVFDRGSANLLRAAAELRRAQERMATLALDIQQAAGAAYARVHGLHGLARQQHTEWLPQQKALVQMLEAQNALGFSSPFALQDARREALQAVSLHVETLRDYWLAEAALRRALGGSRVGGQVALDASD